MILKSGDLRVPLSCVRRLGIVVGLFVYRVCEVCVCGGVSVSEQILQLSLGEAKKKSIVDGWAYGKS